MAKCCQPIGSDVPGISAALLILFIVFSALFALWHFSVSEFDLTFLYSSELWRIFAFTVWQALLSVVLSLLFAIPLAKVVYALEFPGKQWLLRLYTLTFALPAIVLIIGLPQVYGRHGWLAFLYHWIGIDYSFSLFGLSGILIAHVFYNLPFAFRLFYQSLDSISAEERQLSAQLGLSFWQNFRYLEWPVIYRQLLPTAALIFMLCFTSFVIILTLGGGPKNTSFEVAIYQSLRDFELNKVIILSFIQLAFCFLLMWFLRRLSPAIAPIGVRSAKRFFLKPNKLQRFLGYGFILLSALYILSPLVSIIINGVMSMSWSVVLNPNLFIALVTSLIIAAGSGCISFALAILLLWTASRWQFYSRYGLGNLLILMGSVSLAIPSMVLASGFFLLVYEKRDAPWVIAFLIMIGNGLMALPFVLKILENPSKDLCARYELLARSLNVTGLNHFSLIEIKALKSVYLFAFGFACIMSLGDFSIIVVFGSQNFATLPFYLYQQLDAYHSHAANFSALVLLILCLGFFYFIDWLTKLYDRA